MATLPTIIYPARPGDPNSLILVPLGFEADCNLTDAVGDPVKVESAGKVTGVSTNVYTNLMVGILKEKLTDTRCIVIIAGFLSGITSGLSQNKAVFISTSGGLTTTPPTTGHLQTIGTAISPTDLIVSAAPSKVILAP